MSADLRWPCMILVLLPAGTGCGLFDPTSPDLVGCLPAYAEVEQEAATQFAKYHPQGAGLLVIVDGQTVCRLFLGDYGPTTEVYTASAAKWLTAATILAVVDQGTLRLDTRAVELFPDVPAVTTNIVVSQLLSHTSGLLWFSRCMGRPDRTLQACAEDILWSDLQFEPGTGFFYSGPPFTVAGAMAERASRRPWAELFQSLIATPLGMSHTSYGKGPNPALSEGEVVTTLDDYGRFAQMILDQGAGRHRRVLSPEAILEMRRSRSSSVRGEPPYGLGVWLSTVDPAGVGTVLSSPGIGGFFPLVDYGRRMVFVFETFDDIDRIGPGISAILQITRAVVDRVHGIPASREVP